MRLPKASDLVVASIRHRILTERLPVGTRLTSETELMEEHGLGRVTVREALRLLERDGLITIRRGSSGGIFVREVGIDQISDGLALIFSAKDVSLGEFAEFRLHLEPLVARQAAVKASAEQRQELGSIASRRSDGKVVADFHGLVAQASLNRVHAIVLAALRSSLERQVRQEFVNREYSDRNIRDHVAIADAINAGDPDRAEESMREHLIGYRTFIERAGLLEASVIPHPHQPATDLARRPPLGAAGEYTSWI